MWTFPYIYNVCLNDYMMKVFPILDEVASTCYVDVWSVKVCGLVKGLLSMCEVMDLHMHIEIIE